MFHFVLVENTLKLIQEKTKTLQSISILEKSFMLQTNICKKYQTIIVFMTLFITHILIHKKKKIKKNG